MERDQAIKFMQDLLRALVQKGASDLFITTGFPPAMKADGQMTPMTDKPLSADQSAALLIAFAGQLDQLFGHVFGLLALFL